MERCIRIGARSLKIRVVQAAESALEHHRYVLTRTGLLAHTHVESWRKGRLDFLERAIQANLKQITLSMAMFREWARDKGLKPGETRYVRTTRTGTVDLQFSKSADPAIEKNYRTHYISPALSERKQERMTQKPSSPAQPVVFEILLDSTCSECGVELPGGNFLLMEAGQPLCFPCARLSGRVGRTLAGRNLEESALTAAVAAAVRHQHSEYDAMLAAAMDRLLARQQIAGRVLAILAAWRE